MRTMAAIAAAHALGSTVSDVASVRNGSRRVARVTLADGRIIAVKRSDGGTDAHREASCLRFLYGRGAQVPEPLGAGLLSHGYPSMSSEAQATAGDLTPCPSPGGTPSLDLLRRRKLLAPSPSTPPRGDALTPCPSPGGTPSPPAPLPGGEGSQDPAEGEGQGVGVVRGGEFAALERAVASGRGWGSEGQQDHRGSWLATAWVGDESLDDALQVAPSASRVQSDALGMDLACAIATIEAALAEVSARGAPHDARMVGRALIAPWALEARSALAWLGVRSALASTTPSFVRLADESAMTVGALDYHAGNVVVPRSRQSKAFGGRDPLIIVDLESVGWDWPARRVAQYAFATGASGSGTFRSALTPAVLDVASATLALVHGGAPSAWADAIRAHAVILVAMAATHLRHVAEGTAHAQRARAWHDVEGRRASLRAISSDLLA